MLAEGTQAPDFTLQDQNGNTHSLADYRGQRVILYFYPKDMTSGCTSQACGFAERYPLIREKGAVVLGVSRDSVERHKRFEEKYGLPFTLLADPDAQVHQAYDVLQTKQSARGPRTSVVRTTYLIGEDGTIQKAMAKVRAKSNADDMLALL